jgi:hypothetical protein
MRWTTRAAAYATTTGDQLGDDAEAMLCLLVVSAGNG